MTYEEYIAIASEVKELESLLADIPEENVIERIGLESRLEAALAAVLATSTSMKAKQFDKVFDNGADISEFLDVSKAKRPEQYLS